jgi:benzoyl-CoA reductase subunit BamC
VITVKGSHKNRVIKEIKVDISKCTGCRSCELACSAFHAIPKYSSINPAKARIRVYMDELNDQFVPIRAGGYVQAECNGRNMYVIGDSEYSECAFCPASCPSRDYFKDPDSGLPLKCDMCEDVPPLEEPMCVQACKFNALSYTEREEDYSQAMDKETADPVELKNAYDALIKRYGMEKVLQTFSQLSKR